MAESTSNINDKYAIQIECLNFDISIPMERRAVVAYLLDNKHRVDPNWLIEKVTAARTSNCEKFYEGIPNGINLVDETVEFKISNNAIKNVGYQNWKGKVREYDIRRLWNADKLRAEVGSSVRFDRTSCVQPIYKFSFTNVGKQTIAVGQNIRFPEFGVYCNASTGALGYYIDQICQYRREHQCGIQKPICTINDEQVVEYYAALNGLKKILDLRHSSSAYTYNMFTRQTFEKEYNLHWFNEN